MDDSEKDSVVRNHPKKDSLVRIILKRLKLFRSLFLIVTILSLNLHIDTSTSSSDNSTNLVIRELREIKTSLEKESSSAFWSDIQDTILTILSVAATVFSALYLFRLGQETIRKNTIQRSCKTLLRELDQTNESFQNDENRIRRSYFERFLLSDIPKIRVIDYNSAIIVTDAYDSILHSAFFTEFRSETQHVLSTLYDRIRMHNRLIHAISQFEGTTQKMLEYQLYLTKLESDIITTLYLSIEEVRSERLDSIPRSRLKNLVQLKGNLDHLVQYGSPLG